MLCSASKQKLKLEFISTFKEKKNYKPNNIYEVYNYLETNYPLNKEQIDTPRPSYTFKSHKSRSRNSTKKIQYTHL